MRSEEEIRACADCSRIRLIPLGAIRIYQCHVDLVLAKCPRPITKEAIRVILVADGEKPSTARLLAGDYFKMITAVLDPETKLHREAARSITTWGQP